MEYTVYPHTWDFKGNSGKKVLPTLPLRNGTEQGTGSHIIDSPQEFGDGSVTVQDVLLRRGRDNVKFYRSGRILTNTKKGLGSKLRFSNSLGTGKLSGYFLLLSTEIPTIDRGKTYIGKALWTGPDDGFDDVLTKIEYTNYLFPMKSGCIGNRGYTLDVTSSSSYFRDAAFWRKLFDYFILGQEIPKCTITPIEHSFPRFEFA